MVFVCNNYFNLPKLYVKLPKAAFLTFELHIQVPHMNYVIAISEICKVRDDDLIDFDVYKLKATNDYIKKLILTCQLQLNALHVSNSICLKLEINNIVFFKIYFK